MVKLRIWLTQVATAAPVAPQPAAKIKIGSNATFTSAPTIKPIMESTAFPSALKTLFKTKDIHINGAEIKINRAYSLEYCNTLSLFAPNNRISGVKNKKPKIKISIPQTPATKKEDDATLSAPSRSRLPNKRETMLPLPIPKVKPIA